MLFKKELRDKVLEDFDPKINFFFRKYKQGKYMRQEKLIIKDDQLWSKNISINLDPNTLISLLKKKEICPGTFITFTILIFLNYFKCLGSFRTVEYLSHYKERFLDFDYFKDKNIDKIPVANLTTGMFSDNPNKKILDVIMGNEKFNPDPNMLFGELLLPMIEDLINTKDYKLL